MILMSLHEQKIILLCWKTEKNILWEEQDYKERTRCRDNFLVKSVVTCAFQSKFLEQEDQTRQKTKYCAKNLDLAQGLEVDWSLMLVFVGCKISDFLLYHTFVCVIDYVSKRFVPDVQGQANHRASLGEVAAPLYDVLCLEVDSCWVVLLFERA